MENPKIRFKGFTKDWEQRKLGDMGSTFTGLSGKTKENFGHGDAQFITYMNVFSNPIANLEMTEAVEIDAKQNRVKKGDVFFTTSSETPEEVGMSCVMPENKDNIYLNSFCFGYRPTEKFDLDYLAYVLRADSFRKEMTFLAQGISRYNISKNKVMEVSIPIPNLEEQTMVGRYFSNLDHLITLHQRKCEQTKKLKKYMLQKMFPQNGAKVPEIRFDGFTYDWEQRKFKELCDMVTVGIANSATHAYSDSGVVMFRNQNIKPNFLDDTDIIHINSEFEVKYKNKRLKKNDLLVARTGYPGTACVVPEKYENSQTFTTLIARPNENVDPYFLCQYLNSDIGIKYFESTQIGGGQKNSGAGILNEMPVILPSTIEEEKQIADYFIQLDNLITLHQRKCDELKKMKKYMLQNMFI